MHQQEQNLQNMHQFSSSCFFYQFLKKIIQIAVSFSVFSFLFFYPSWPPFFPSFTSYLSTLSSRIFSFSSDKNYIFLLCNGILVFIAKYSGHMADTCQPPLPDTSLGHDFLYRQSMQLAAENSVLVEDVAATHEDEDEDESRTDINEVVQEEEDVEEKYVIYQTTYEALKEEEYDVISNDDDDKEYMMEESDFGSYEEQQNYNKVVEEEEEEQEHEKEAIAKMSTEELNRKFDDFIRKMKEDLRIEARQQLIVA